MGDRVDTWIPCDLGSSGEATRDLGLRPRVVDGETARVAVADPVGTAVADRSHRDVASVPQRRYERARRCRERIARREGNAADGMLGSCHGIAHSSAGMVD